MDSEYEPMHGFHIKCLIPLPALYASQELGQSVHRHLPDIRQEDLPSIIAIIASLCPADSFLLTEITEMVLNQLDAFTPMELKALVDGYGSQWVKRSFFDDDLFKG
jgi:hypothetical protein